MRIALFAILMLSLVPPARAADLCAARMNGATVDHVEVVNSNAVENTDDSTVITFLQSLHGASTQWVICSFDGSRRKQYPGAGYTYDVVADVFISPRPFPSWTLDANHDWQAPVPMPQDGQDWFWDEGSGTWKLH